jgi:chromosome segregation ATPase
MHSNKKIILLLTLLMPMFLLLSCLPEQSPPKVVVQPNPVEEQQRASVAKRFQESASQIENPTVVESAMELSKKHAKLSEEAAVLRQQNKEHIVRNQQLENQVVALESQLRQAQKELSEANELLMTMRIELNNWKVDILGFRDEMRDAETAQLEALLKILKVLGGEVEAESAQGGDAGPEVASLSEPEQPK